MKEVVRQGCRYEILAPVADWEMLCAAVHNGAQSVYFGVPGFNARGRTPNFDRETLKKFIDFCHLHKVRAFLAFNVLIFEDELEAICGLVREIVELSPDGIIVQDVGLARLIKEICPSQELHASTQMTVGCAEAIKATESLDISRYILPRELAVDEISQIQSSTTKELEVFVHGALCVSFSGQCLTSESIGGRSANRGQCAQSCRFEYDLIVDGQKKELGAKRFLVSPYDLNAREMIPALVKSGVRSFKIEGRYKSPQYVAYTTKVYCNALDMALGRSEGSGSGDAEDNNLGIIYSRGFSTGWLNGVDHQRLVGGEYANHHGLKVGKIRKVLEKAIEVDCTYDVQPGDGLVFCDFENGREVGTFVYEVKKLSPKCNRIRFSNAFDLNALSRGMLVFLNQSPALEKEISRSFLDKQNFHRVPIEVKCDVSVGEHVKLNISDYYGNNVTVESDELVDEAKTRAVTKDDVLKELSALGGTCFELRKSKITVSANAFVNLKALKRLRQIATAKLEALLIQASLCEIRSLEEVNQWHKCQVADVQSEKFEKTREVKSAINVLVREASQLDALEGLGIGTVYLDYEFGKDYERSVQRVREYGYRVAIASTRVAKPGECKNLGRLVDLGPDEFLVRNLGALEWLKGKDIKLVGDFSLNVANSLAAVWYLSSGLERICPSYDLNSDQLYQLVNVFGGKLLEVTVHQYMPTFHMDYCLFAAHLSRGHSYRDCGMPCCEHRVELRDRNGNLHLVKADYECRNTMFNSTPQSAARLIPKLQDKGVRNFRIEALFESADVLRKKITAYAKVIAGETSYEEAFSQLMLVEKYGVSEGQLMNRKNYQDRKKA